MTRVSSQKKCACDMGMREITVWPCVAVAKQPQKEGALLMAEGAEAGECVLCGGKLNEA